jgi:hypothetical protein
VQNQHTSIHHPVHHMGWCPATGLMRTCWDYFLAASALVSLAGALLGSALAGVLAAGAGAVTAGLASTFFSSFLAGSAAKAVTANAEAIKVATNFMIKFLLGYVEISIPTYI